MSARLSWRQSVEADNVRPVKHRRIGRGLRHSARFARYVLAAPRRVLVLRRSTVGRARGISHTSEVSGSPAAPLPRTPLISAQAKQQPEVNKSLLTGELTLSRRLRFCLVNLCTISSLGLGITAIFAAMHGEPRLGAALLLACVAFDGLDGALARRLGVSTPFGAQMDSLADMCSFGIATPVVAYAWLVGPTPAYVVGPICALVGVCAAIRLARFNISPNDGNYFTGVPTTMAAAIIVLTALLMPNPVLVAPAALVAVLALLMVSTFPYVKFNQLRRLPFWTWILPLGLLFVNPFAAFVLIIGCYLLSGPVLWMKERRT